MAPDKEDNLNLDRIRLTVLYVVGVFSLAIVSGCAIPKYPAAPGNDDVDVDGYEYSIGEGDSLKIFVWGYDDLSDSIAVRPDGRITTKLVEDMPAAGKTPTELARELETEYEKFVTKPAVTVSINDFVGNRIHQVKIIGAASNSQTVPYNKGMSLLDLLIQAGGLGEHSSGNRSVLVREVDGERVNFSLKIDDLIRGAKIEENILLLPGDIVIIPESWF